MNTDHSEHYSEKNLAQKLASQALKIGKGTVEKGLYMHEALKDEQTPAWAKATIIGALGYLISPVDAVPDVVPAAGYADDIGVIALAFASVAAHVTEVHIKNAKVRMQAWFG